MFQLFLVLLFGFGLVLSFALSASQLAVAVAFGLFGGISGASTGIGFGGGAENGAMIFAMVAFNIGGLAAYAFSLRDRRDNYPDSPDPDPAVSYLPGLFEAARAKLKAFLDDPATDDGRQPKEQREEEQQTPRPSAAIPPPSKQTDRQSSDDEGSSDIWTTITCVVLLAVGLYQYRDEAFDWIPGYDWFQETVSSWMAESNGSAPQPAHETPLPSDNQTRTASAPAESQESSQKPQLTMAGQRITPAEARAYDEAIRELENNYPRLSPDSTKFDQALVDQVAIRRNQLIRDDVPPARALRRAVADSL